MSGVAPQCHEEETGQHNKLPTLSHFTFRVQISPSVFNSLQTVPYHRTTSGLHSQANPGLHTLAGHVCFTANPGIHVHKVTLLPSPFMSSAHSLVMSSHTWSPISPTVSLYCHSLNLTDIGTETPCNVIISPWENQSAIRGHYAFHRRV